MTSYFITGIGTGIGKTVVAAIITEALHADYWKPVQAGYADGTDSGWLKSMLTNNISVVHQESYLLKLAASPHLGAGQEGIEISLDKILSEDISRLFSRILKSPSFAMSVVGRVFGILGGG